METVVPTKVFTTYKKLKEVTPKELNRDDQNLALLSDTAGWSVLKGIIESQIESLNALNGAISPEDTVEAVGFKFLAANIASYHLQSIINIVEATRKVVDEQEK